MNTLVLLGELEFVGFAPDGDRLYRMTDKGRAKVEKILRDRGVDPDDPAAVEKLKSQGFFTQ